MAMPSCFAFMLHMCLLVDGSATCMGPTCAADVPTAPKAAVLLQSKINQHQFADDESAYESPYDESPYDESPYDESPHGADATYVLESGMTLALPPLEVVPLEYMEGLFESEDTLQFFQSILSASLAVPETDVIVLSAHVSDSSSSSASGGGGAIAGASLLSKTKNIGKEQYPQAALLFKAKNIKTKQHPKAALLLKASRKKLKKTQRATDYEITIKFSVLESPEAASKISSLGSPGSNEQATFVTTLTENMVAAASQSDDPMFQEIAAASAEDGISVEKVDEAVIKPYEEPEPTQAPAADGSCLCGDKPFLEGVVIGDWGPDRTCGAGELSWACAADLSEEQIGGRDYMATFCCEAGPPPAEEIPGYVTTEMWSEVCGKGCDTAGMTCIMDSMSPKECAETCDALDECKAFQMPEADNGFHGWCVWFDYNVQPQDNSHYCHEGNYVYNKDGPSGANGGYVDCNWETEETCYDASSSPVGCAKISEGGCPCKEGEIKCGGDEFEPGWCQVGPCPVHCDWQSEETCFDENWLAVSCSRIGEGGCPCLSPQIKCGAHDGYAGWCQDAPCPVTCDWETEYTCYDENWAAVSCAHKETSGGCPCPSEQVRCGSDEHYEGWCQDAPCPVTCDWQIEDTCYDDNWNAVSCSLISEGGCPCKEGQSKCGAMDEPYLYAGYCHDGACPLTCDWEIDETCYDDNWVAVSCAKISEGGCPCKEGQQKCGAFPEDNIVGWCSDSECPITCNWKIEESCYDDSWVLTGCAKISDGGCPCSGGMEKCGAFPADNIAGWCQEGPCPLACNYKIEDTCYDDNWSPVSCAPISDGGCPCKEGETKCGAYAAGTWGADSHAYAGYCTDVCWDSSTAARLFQQAKHENAAELVLSVRGQYHVFALGGKEKRALRKELKQLKLDHAVQLHTGYLNKTLSSFLATHTGDAVEFASLAGNHSRASNLLMSLRPHLHTGAVLQFRDLMNPKEKKQLNQLLEANHKAGFHLAPVKDDGKDELFFRITGTK